MESARRASLSSDFGRRTADLRGLDDSQIFSALLRRGYDAMVFFSPNRAMHFAFQAINGGGNRRNVFYAEIVPSKRGQGLLHGFAREFLEYSRLRGVKQVQFGNGGHPASQKVIARLKRDEEELGIIVNTERCLVDL